MELHGEDALKIFNYFVNEKKMKAYISTFKGKSIDFIDNYQNSSLGFVYIDISNDYESIIDEINRWIPKIRAGGIIGGDDYSSFGVKQAVDEYFRNPELLDKGLDKRNPDEFCSWYKIL